MTNKIMIFSILMYASSCNAMDIVKLMNASKMSKFNMEIAISNHAARKGARKNFERTKENAYDIFIDEMEAHPKSSGKDLKDFLLTSSEYSERYYQIKDSVCKIHDDILGISQKTFSRNRNFKFVQLPNNLLGIDTAAFSYTNIVEIYIPDSVVAIAPYAFFRCKDLKHVSISSKTLVLDNAFNGCPNIVITYRD